MSSGPSSWCMSRTARRNARLVPHARSQLPTLACARTLTHLSIDAVRLMQLSLHSCIKWRCIIFLPAQRGGNTMGALTPLVLGASAKCGV